MVVDQICLVFAGLCNSDVLLLLNKYSEVVYHYIKYGDAIMSKGCWDFGKNVKGCWVFDCPEECKWLCDLYGGLANHMLKLQQNF